jgi:hypothetical protein
MISLWVVLWSSEAFAQERAALALSGPDCRLSHQAIIEMLERLEGVTRVEAETIPDHLLVDHDGLRRTGESLAGFVNGLAALQGPLSGNGDAVLHHRKCRTRRRASRARTLVDQYTTAGRFP